MFVNTLTSQLAAATQSTAFTPLLCIMMASALSACSSISDDEVELIAKLTGVAEGTSIADVGAGGGELVPDLTVWVGPAGQVYATELDPENVAAISELAQREELDNVTALLGTPDETGLPRGCCDAIVMRMVYHHFTEPEPFINSLYASLKPGGRLLVIDFQPSFWMSTSTPSDLPEDRQGQHGVLPATVIKEVTSNGFSLRHEVSDWPGPGSVLLTHFGLVFVRE